MTVRSKQTRVKLEEEKKKKFLRRFVKRSLLLVFTLALVALSGSQAWKYAGPHVKTAAGQFTSDHLVIRELVITGASDYAEKDIRSYVETIVKVNPNLLTFPLAAVQGFLSNRTYLSKAEVRKEFPGRLVISIGEKKTLALLVRNGYHLLDENGEIIRPMSIGENLDFPVVTIDESAAAANLDTGLKAACSLIQLDNKSLPNMMPSEVRITADSIVLKSLDLKNRENVMPPIYFSTEGLERNVLRVKKLWPELLKKRDEIEYIDGRLRQGIAVKSKTAEEKHNG